MFPGKIAFAIIFFFIASRRKLLINKSASGVRKKEVLAKTDEIQGR